MDNDKLFGPAAQQKRVLAQLRDVAQQAGVPNVKELVPEGPMTEKAKDQLSKGFARKPGDRRNVFSSSRVPHSCLILATVGEEDGEDSQLGLFRFDDTIQGSCNPALAQTQREGCGPRLTWVPNVNVLLC